MAAATIASTADWDSPAPNRAVARGSSARCGCCFLNSGKLMTGARCAAAGTLPRRDLNLRVRLRQIGDGIVGEALRLDLAALSHVKNTLGDDLFGDPPITRRSKCTAGFLDLSPRVLVRCDQLFDHFGIERGL